MSLFINTNIASLYAQNNVANSQNALATSIQRLSSGLRINSAKDDAAGMAIAARMTSQIGGMTQAAQNANDGISLAQTAEGALAQVTNDLQTMRNLSVQAANGTNSAGDRASIQASISQLQNDISQISSNTQYNGLNLLDGSLQNVQFQVGANAGQTIDASIGTAAATAIGNYAVTATGTGAATLGSTNGALPTTGNGVSSGSITVLGNGASSGAITIGTAESADVIAAAVTAAAGNTNVSVTAQNVVTLSGFAGAGNVSFSLQSISVSATGTKTTQTANISATMASATDYSGLVSQINAQTSSTGITAAVSGTTITLTQAKGTDIAITNSSAAGFTMTGMSGSVALGTSGAATNAAEAGGVLTFNAPQSFSVASTSNIAAATPTLHSVALIDVTTMSGGIPTGANSALSVVDAAINYINGLRATLGALQNRFTNAQSSLTTTSTNMQQARSRIQDTDFAAETANLTHNQILQQAGTAMLAQANALPNSVLTLLK